MANRFNNYYVQIGPNLAKNINNSKNSFADYLTNINCSIEQTKLNIYRT